MRCLALAILFSLSVRAQTIAECRERFNRHLNHKGGLSGLVTFEKDAVFISTGGNKKLAIYQEELQSLAKLLEFGTEAQQRDFLRRKGMKRISAQQRDSLLRSVSEDRATIRKVDSLPLRGYRIAIDPGHFGVTQADAAIERKFLYFIRTNAGGMSDTIRLFESNLTFTTARILADLLREKGADVFLTRNEAGHTSFNCTYSEWIKRHRLHTVDSLYKVGRLTLSERNRLLRATPAILYREFFRDYELINRARIINAYQPHVAVIIHYNVDETNAPWTKQSRRNYTMAFIPGAFTASDLQKPENLADFTRLLIGSQLPRSGKLAGLTVQAFQRHLQVPVAKSSDAIYLRDNCMPGGMPGVFSRNLVLCRKVNAVLVYGESLYQDNEAECAALMKCDTDMFGVKTSERVGKVAVSYYEALFDFLLN